MFPILRLSRISLAAALLALTLHLPSPLQAQQPPDPAPKPARTQGRPQAETKPAEPGAGPGPVEMNFQNVEIGNFLSIMSRAFGVPFVWDEQTVKGRVTLQSVQKFSKEDAYKLFETALGMQGYTLLRVEGSPVVQVVPIQEAARLATPINPARPETAPGNVFVTRIVTLKYAEPEGVKAALTPLLAKSTGVATYGPANALILSDTEENLARYEKIIAQLDVPPGDAEFVVIPLKYASARRLAPILTAIAAEVATGRPVRGRPPAQGAGRKITIVSDDRTNSIIIGGDPADLPPLRRLIEALDVPGAPEVSGFKIYALKFANAANLATILKEINQATTGQQRAAPRKEGEAAAERLVVVITADRPTNSLIVFAPPEVTETFDRLVELLDVPGRAEEANFKIYTLRYASALEMVRILQQFKETAPAPVARPRGQEGGAAEGGAPSKQDVVIAADRPTNSVIVFAPPEIVETFDRLVATLDVPGRTQESLFKIYRLQYAAADELARLLQDVKRVGETGAIGPESRARPQAPAPGGAAAAGETPVVLITADVPTNTLIVFGPPQMIETFDRLVEALDIPGRVKISTFKVYRLQHASAEELAKVLTEVKSGAEQATQEPGQPGAPRPVQPARAAGTGAVRTAGLDIAADKATNSLIVFGTAENIRTMDAIVAELDIRRPQVYVEALIMEITLEKSLQLGINWQGSARVGDSVVGGGFPNAQPQTLSQALSGGTGAALGIIGNEIEFQGQKFTTFSGFIQATRQDLDLNILANPQILTLDNEKAEINVSQVIPVSAKIVRDVNNQTTTEFEFKDVGVILAITPQITGNDKVLLTIQQESSSVAAQQVSTSQTQQAITTLKRTINSKVLIDDGATMAIGGLIQDNTQETVTKVPCLGDIPVLGWFFKSRSEGVRKTNMIVFLRPHIIQSREDLERISAGAQSRYDATREPGTDVENSLREGFNLNPRPEPPPEEEQ